MKIAFTREISPNFNQCELTHLDRQPIDLALARQQHHEYEDALSAVGCIVCRLPAEAGLPDSVFVEDCALVVDEAAVITRPGADSRRAEVEAIARVLAPYRKLYFVQPPGVVDGGDILRVERRIWIGLSTRSNQPACDQMRDFLGPYGYEVNTARLAGCLHLKSAVTQVAPNALLLNPAWVDPAAFPGFDIIEVHPAEPSAANAVLVGETIIYPKAYPRTLERLQARGIQTVLVDASEVAKAEGAVTCCSLLLNI